jgi:type IV secretion system protein VirB2
MVKATKKSAQAGIDMGWHLLVLFAAVVGSSLLPEMAQAATANVIQGVFCNVVMIMTGTTGKALATVAIIAVGVGALLGKISWGMALIVALGVALVFGAASIVTALGGASGACVSSTLTSA